MEQRRGEVIGLAVRDSNLNIIIINSQTPPHSSCPLLPLPCTLPCLSVLVIKLMSYLPVLKGKSQNKFTNPLSGFVYDNKKYAESCIIDAMPARNNPKCKSVPHTFFKQRPPPSLSSQDIVEREFRLTNKIFNLTKRLSDHNKLRCTRSKWIQFDTDTPHIAKATAPVHQMLQNRPKNVQGKAFRFPEIRALILSIFHANTDQDKSLKLSLKSYFQLFFKDTLAGILFPELIAAVQKHLRNIAAQQQTRGDEQSEIVSPETLDNQYANILSKQELYVKLHELDVQGRQQMAQKLVRAYCLPKKQVRAVFMQDLLKLISVQLYQNFNCNRHSQYTLLREDGQPITDFAGIGFCTGFLFIAERGKQQQQYQRYIEITHNHSRLKNRFQFREQLKQNFRQKVAKGNFFDSSMDQKTARQAAHQRRNNVERAQLIVDTKNQKNSNSRIKLSDKRGITQNITQAKSKSKSKSKDKISVQPQHKKETVSPFSIDRKIQQQFRMLKLKNDFSNTILKNDETAKDKIQLSILMKECVYFKEKSLPQIERILAGLDFIQKGQQYEHYHQRLITLQDYTRMRKIINCIGQRQHTIRFIDGYLCYDQFGEISREDFRKVLAFIVGGENKTTDVILNTIWEWLDHNGATSPSGIRRLDMQVLYQRNKLVYYFLISLIFGTNQVSVLELTQDMLA